MKNLIGKFLKDETGATAIEYGLIAALMSVLLIAAMPFITESLELVFNNIGGALNNAAEEM